jgi:hypothetical protein
MSDMAAAGAVASIAVGGALAAGTLRGSDQSSPIGEPTTPSPTTAAEPAEPGSPEELDAILVRAAAQAPGWAVADHITYDDYAFNGPCSGSWARGTTAGTDGA